MADQGPSKNDIQLVFKRLRSITTNKACFDCNAKNPTWASVTYGVFICIDCSAVHRSLGVHVTFVRSTQLDTNWTWLQLRQMQLGGNANALTFFRQHNCTTTDAQQKYTSRAAQLYREKLHSLAIQAMRLHGTKLHLDAASEQHTSEDKKEEEQEPDFFAEHTNFESPLQFSNATENHSRMPQMEAVSDPAMSLAKSQQPNVDTAALGVNLSDVSQDQRKPTIGVRKPQAKRPGLGAKKGGLGAQKVKTNFAEIEREAALADQLKVQAAEEAKLLAEKSAEEEQKQIASMRLAYQDLSLQQKKEEEKLKQVDPKKAQQIERLGMGFASRTGVSHSALSDMKTIEQESPNKLGGSKTSLFDRDSDRDGFFDDFRYSPPSPGFGMYKSNSNENKTLEAMFLDGNTSRDRYSSSKPWGSFEPESKQPSSNSYSSDDRPSPRREPLPAAPTTNEAQKKFGSAKAISSDQYFGDTMDSTWERKANLSRFEGSSSISSADYFGTGNSQSSGGSHITTPDLEDVKESVRQGVTKVAGKLSSIANGVMSTIQDRYGY